jgi:AAA15 family ATPase/GTPase
LSPDATIEDKIIMKESIIIKNFGPLKEVEIDDIKPLTVFIGKSAGGKSIIMKVIVLMRYIYKMVNIRSYLKNAKITRSPFKLRFNSLLHDGLKGMITAQTEIYYTVEINGNKYTLKYTNRGLQSDINIPDKDLIFFKEAYVSGIEVHEQKIYASAKPDMNYISGSDKRCLDAAITKYKDTDPYDLSDLSHDLAWKEARARIKDNPQKNLITIIDIARAGKANKEMIDYIREKQIVRNALS